MFDLTQVGKLFLMTGAILLVLGGVLVLADQIPWLGQLPGDISYKSDHFRVYAPLTTMLIISILLTLILNLIAGS